MVYASLETCDGFGHDGADHHYSYHVYGGWRKNGKMALIPLQSRQKRDNESRHTFSVDRLDVFGRRP
jgi:hypothetical protein